MQELLQIKKVLLKLVGASNRSVKNSLSEEILDKFAKEFLNSVLQRLGQG